MKENYSTQEMFTIRNGFDIIKKKGPVIRAPPLRNQALSKFRAPAGGRNPVAKTTHAHHTEGGHLIPVSSTSAGGYDEWAAEPTEDRGESNVGKTEPGRRFN